MDCGTANNHQYIDVTGITSLPDTKQSSLPVALTGLHVFTGCGFTSSFYRKGKIKPYEILENDDGGRLIQFFCSLSSIEEPSQKIAEEYVCYLYGMKGLKHVNEARYTKLV